MDLRFRERGQVRKFAAEHGMDKLEEELDSGRLDLRSVILVEQWLEDEPLRAANRRRRKLQRLWNIFVVGVCVAAAAGVGMLVWALAR